MTLRISDLPREVRVRTDDYLVINANNKVTSSISAYNFAAYMGQFIFDLDLIPDFNLDGGNVAPPGSIIDGGKPDDTPKPGVTVIDGGTPTFVGYGPNIDGGYFDSAVDFSSPTPTTTPTPVSSSSSTSSSSSSSSSSVGYTYY